MENEYRPDVLGTLPEIRKLPAREAIERIEKDLMGAAECLRGIRSDYVNGKISEDEFDKIEAEFAERLIQQRQMLQNLRMAAAQEDSV